MKPNPMHPLASNAHRLQIARWIKLVMCKIIAAPCKLLLAMQITDVDQAAFLAQPTSLFVSMDVSAQNVDRTSTAETLNTA